MKRIPAFVLLAAAACGGAEDRDVEEAPPLIATHLAYEDDRPGLDPMDVGGRQLFVEPQPVFSDADIIGANTTRGEESVIVDVRLDAAGAERLRTATAENVGRSMVLMFDSRVVSASVIRGEIGGSPGMHIQMGVPAGAPEEVDEIVELVRARWPSEDDSADG